MPNIKDHPRLFVALLLSVFSTWAQAEDDWLISRVNGQWTWESAGPEGRVRKSFLHQEVLHRTEDGQIVAVSALPIREGETIQCSESVRRNPKEACSSAFLACKPSGSALSSLSGLLLRGAQGATDARRSYSCSLDVDAVLDAALAVGLIERDELEAPAKSLDR